MTRFVNRWSGSNSLAKRVLVPMSVYLTPHRGLIIYHMSCILYIHSDKYQYTYMGSRQNSGPFLGTLNIRCRIILRTQTGTIILTTTHVQTLFMYVFLYAYVHVHGP